MAGPRKRKAGAPRARARTARPALGNDPFERGAAPRPAAARRARPLTGPGEVEERADRLGQRADAALGSAERRLAEVVRRAGAVGYAEEARELLARLLPALRGRLRSVRQLAALLEGAGPLDPHGMDPRLVERAAPLLDFLYETWWRVEARSLDQVPAGGAVVVANHGGTLPWDALVLRLALAREPAGREARPLLDPEALALPFLGKALVRLGAVPATPENARALLARGALVGVFPEGSRGGSKPWADRYRLQHFGRGGFAKVALRAGAPVVPCAIVGSEEATPPPARSGWLAEALGLPLLALAPSLPLGPLAFAPLPSRWSIRFGAPVDTRALGPAAADDPAVVSELAGKVRLELQRMLDEDLGARRSVFL